MHIQHFTGRHRLKKPVLCNPPRECRDSARHRTRDICPLIFQIVLRDRPFNLKGVWLWFFVSFRIFFSDNTRVRIFIFLSRKVHFFFQNLTLGYMTKTLNHIIFFFLHQNQNIFSATLGIRIFF